jgi:hypothetical protein
MSEESEEKYVVCCINYQGGVTNRTGKVDKQQAVRLKTEFDKDMIGGNRCAYHEIRLVEHDNVDR